MIKSKTMKYASLLVAGTWMMQFTGCFGDFWRILLFNVPVGAGRAVGAIPGNIISNLITPLLPVLGG